jgi:hypothetical protein
MSRHPHQEGWHTCEETSVLGKRALLRFVNGEERVSYFEPDGVAFEEVGEQDEVLARGGVGIGDELVVR